VIWGFEQSFEVVFGGAENYAPPMVKQDINPIATFTSR
jgi:hypothetical protein